MGLKKDYFIVSWNHFKRGWDWKLFNVLLEELGIIRTRFLKSFMSLKDQQGRDAESGVGLRWRNLSGGEWNQMTEAFCSCITAMNWNGYWNPLMMNGSIQSKCSEDTRAHWSLKKKLFMCGSHCKDVLTGKFLYNFTSNPSERLCSMMELCWILENVLFNKDIVHYWCIKQIFFKLKSCYKCKGIWKRGPVLQDNDNDDNINKINLHC